MTSATQACPSLIVIATLSLGLAACTTTNGAPILETGFPQSPSFTATTEPAPHSSDDTLDETPIRIFVEDRVLEAVLWDNPAARSLLDQLPLTRAALANPDLVGRWKLNSY